MVHISNTSHDNKRHIVENVSNYWDNTSNSILFNLRKVEVIVSTLPANHVDKCCYAKMKIPAVESQVLIG